MTEDETLQRVRAVLGEVRCVPTRELGDLEEPRPLAAPMFATDLLDPSEARRLYRAGFEARQATGLSPMLVAEDAADLVTRWLTIDGLDEELVAFDSTSAEELLAPTGESSALEAALDELGELAGRDPLDLLHRLSLDDILAFDAGDAPEDGWLDEAALLPDDVARAYVEQQARHARFVAEVRANAELAGLPIVTPPMRAPDPSIALDELAIGRAHLVLVGSSPAMALLHLGFGGFNDCPAPHEHARIWGAWWERLGAMPVAVTRDRLHGTIARPVTTRPALVQLAREVAHYDRDLLAEGWLYLAATLYRNASFSFWWD